MIYTFGFQESYDRGIASSDPFQKLGRSEEYLGGAAFPSYDAAAAYVRDEGPNLDGYAVYGLVADWERDTEQLPGEPFRRLLRDATIVAALAGDHS